MPSTHLAAPARILAGLLTGVLTGPPAPVGAPPSPWRAPLATLQVLRPFQAPPGPYAAGHRGVDLAGPAGVPVRATAVGRVVYAARLADRGVVSVDHGHGVRTTYEPVVPLVARGEVVTGGEVIGLLRPGHAGCRSACLHWGLRWSGTYLDPLRLVRRGPARLVPP